MSEVRDHWGDHFRLCSAEAFTPMVGFYKHSGQVHRLQSHAAYIKVLPHLLNNFSFRTSYLTSLFLCKGWKKINLTLGVNNTCKVFKQNQNKVRGFLDSLVVRNPPANAGDAVDVDSILGSVRSPGARNANPLQYSCLENSMDRGPWRTPVNRVTESWTPLSTDAMQENAK